MIKFLLATMLFASTAFAQPQVQVSIDGVQYYCSQDPNNSQVGACEQAAARFTKEYSVCKSVGYTSQSCFNSVNNKVHDSLKGCLEVAEVCNNTCKNAGFTSQSCYRTCYK